MLAALREYAAKNEGNLLHAAIEAARARATLGEISSALEDVFRPLLGGDAGDFRRLCAEL